MPNFDVTTPPSNHVQFMLRLEVEFSGDVVDGEWRSVTDITDVLEAERCDTGEKETSKIDKKLAEWIVEMFEDTFLHQIQDEEFSR